MTRNELKDIIKECLEEITIEESSYDSSCEVFIEEAIINEAKNPERKALVKKISKALKDFAASEGLPDVCFVCSSSSPSKCWVICFHTCYSFTYSFY